MNPPDLGAPALFSHWRAGQDDLLYRLIGSDKRFLVLDAPVGVGKSLVLLTYATAQRLRAVYTTSTRGLQDQVNRDFSVIGLTDVRGMSNYRCLEWPGRQCDQGPCLDGAHCPIRFRGCLYYDAVKEATVAQYALTNYALWMSLGRSRDGKPLGDRDVLILDEAHEAPEKLAEFMSIRFRDDDVSSMARPKRGAADEIGPWQEWAVRELKVVERELGDASPGSAEMRQLKRLDSDLKRLVAIGASERWVWQTTKHGVNLEPMWGAPYAESALFAGISKVILSSATIRPQTLRYLGIDPAHAEFISAPSPFSARRRPIYWVPTVKLGWGMDPFDTRRWLDRLDHIIEGRLDRKGIIHSVSYERAKYIKHASAWRDVIILPDRHSLQADVARFKSMPPPAVLVSPSVGTGYDFPYDAARYQIIAKMPFAPVKTDPVLQLRAEEDRGYPDWLTASALQQMAGRVMRADDDFGETFIIDDHIQWFVKSRRDYFARWFLEAFRKVDGIPPAPGL